MKQDLSIQVLKEFFSAYFHEDWRQDASTTDEVVSAYVEDTPEDQSRALSKNILAYVSMFEGDEDLEESLFHELGCYYMPSGERRSAREWLQGIASSLMQDSSQSGV